MFGLMVPLSRIRVLVAAALCCARPKGREWHYSASLGYGSSSDAEYQALIAALELALQHGAQVLYVFGDSRVILDDVQAPR